MDAMDEQGSLPKKRKGGVLQRLQSLSREVEAQTIALQQPSLLADWLKKQWAWGQLSPQEVQHVASLAKKDMVTAGAPQVPGDLASLASLGTEGAHANNCHRDLLSLVADVSKLPKPLQVQMPMKVKGGKALQSVMVPHLLCHHLFLHYRSFFDQTFMPEGTPGLVKFWKKFQHHPSMQDHWLLSQTDWMATTLPANLHGDAVPTVGCGKVWAKLQQCYSWAGLLSHGSVKQRSFFIFGAPSLAIHTQTSALLPTRLLYQLCGCHFVGLLDPHNVKSWGCCQLLLAYFFRSMSSCWSMDKMISATLHTFFNILKWSFNCLMTGIFPDRDWLGEKHLSWYFHGPHSLGLLSLTV